MKALSNGGLRVPAWLAITTATAVLSGVGVALAGSTGSGGRSGINEQTPTGFAMTLKDQRGCSGGCMFGTMVLRCPTAASEGRGASLGKSPLFKIRRGKPFKASKKDKWNFTGKFDSKQHFKGSGRIANGACGSAPRTFSEPVPKNAVWTQCPTANPVPSNTPITFKGKVVGAALGTSVRIEFGDPHSGTGFVLAHVRTDAAGNFHATHTFPSLGGLRYGAPTWARYPDSPNAHGALCNFFVK